MMLIVLLVLYLLCQILNTAEEYDLKNDRYPNKLLHKIIRRLHLWIYKEEELANV